MGTELTHQIYNQRRKTLGEILPLSMPLMIQIQVTNLCNFKCFYCSGSRTPDERKNEGLELAHMPFDDYKRCIDSIVQSGGTKVLNLLGWGEPLLHPNIADMVRYAKEKKVAQLVRIITNGSLLTPELSDALIDAGLDNLRISLQGLNEEDYRDVSNVKIDFDQFIKNIQYYYEHRKQSTVSLKIMDIMIKGKEAAFDKIFAPICDEYLIDALCDMNDNIDVHGHGSAVNQTFLGAAFLDTNICSAPLFRAYIDVDSQLFPCCHLPMPCKFGDVRENFYAVWNGKEHIRFLLDMVKGQRDTYTFCQNCKLYLSQLLPSDKLDDYRDELIEKYTKLFDNAEKRKGARV